jgi:WD40 repeat protein
MATVSDSGSRSESGRVRLSLGPAPVESKAHVPAPLPVREAQVPKPAPVAPRASENVWAQRMQAAPRAEKPVDEPSISPAAKPRSVVGHPLVIGLIAALALMAITAFIGGVSFSRRITREQERADEATHAARLAQQKADELRNEQSQKQTQADDEVQELRKARDEAITQREKAKQDVQRADASRQAVEKQRQEQSDLRERAEVAAKVAEESRDQALQGRGGAEGKLAHLYAGQGLRAMEHGELPEAFIWLTEALRLTQGDKDRETAQRMRLGAILTDCPRPLQAWFHDKPVTHFEMSADGRRVLTISKAGAARLFDTATGKLIGEPLAAGGEMTQAHFSRDGARVATAAADQTARVWDATTGKPITAALEHPGAILAIAISADGKRLHTINRAAANPAAGFNTPVSFNTWNTATGEAVGEPWQFGHPVQTAAFTPEGRSVLSISPDGRAHLTDITGKNSAVVFDTSGSLRRIAFSIDGQFAGTCNSEKTARVWSVSKRTAVSPPLVHPDPVLLIAVSSDGQRAATSGADHFVRIWDARTGQRILQMRQPAVVSALSFSPDGRHLFVAGQDGVARVWNPESGVEVVPPLMHGGAILADSGYGSGGDRLLTADEQSVRLWDLTVGEKPYIPADKAGDRLTYSPDGKQFARITGDSVQVYATETGKAVGEAIKHKHDISLIVFSADGKRILTLSQKPGQDSADVELRVSDAATGKPAVPPIEPISLVQHAAISPDGGRISAATAEQKVYLWETASGKEIGRPLDLRQNVTYVLFSPDGSKLITATAPGDVRVHDATSGEPISPKMSHGQALSYLAVTPDSKQLITATANGTANLLDITTGESIAGPFGHGSPVLQVIFSTDGSRAATAGSDGTARVWDTKTGKSITQPLHHDNAVTQLAFSTDGRRLATASGDRIHLWDASTGESLGPDIIPWRGGAIVRRLEFTKEGKLIASHGQPGDLSARHTLSVNGEARGSAELAQLGVVLTGRHLDAGGAIVAVEAAEARKAWDELHAKAPKDFAAEPERILAWYRRGAGECEQNKNWEGLLRNVQKLAELEPKRAEHRVKLARTYAELGRRQDAAAEYRKALELEPKNMELLMGIARAELEQKKWQAATEWLDRAVVVGPEDREVFALRGRAFAELGKLDKAAADFDKAMTLGSNDAAIWYQRNLLRLAAGDLDGYRKTCLRMVRRFGEGDAANTRLVGWTCSIGPDGLADLKPVIKRVERIVIENPASAPDRLVLALLKFRAGQFAEAASAAEAVVKAGNLRTAPLLLAMIQHRLDHTEDAKKTLDKTPKPDDPTLASLTWDERLAYQLLRREAEALLKNTKS